MPEDLAKDHHTKRKILIALSVGLFLLSLTRECYCTTNQCGDSLAALLVGWMGIPLGGAALTWLANPLLLLCWIQTKSNSKYALIFSGAATVTCLSFLLFDTVVDTEAGHYNEIIEYKAGYWLWSASAATMLAGNLILKYSRLGGTNSQD